MATVYLASLRQLGPALRSLGRETERTMIKSLRQSASYGRTAVVRTTKRTRDPYTIRASGSYENNWVTSDLPDGAVLANAVFYALFVERGRKPGKMPPLGPILKWVKQKKVVAVSGREAQIAIARLIQRKIGRKGTKGRWVLRRTMPMIAKRAAIDIRKALRDLSNNPPKH